MSTRSRPATHSRTQSLDAGFWRSRPATISGSDARQGRLGPTPWVDESAHDRYRYADGDEEEEEEEEENEDDNVFLSHKTWREPATPTVTTARSGAQHRRSSSSTSSISSSSSASSVVAAAARAKKQKPTGRCCELTRGKLGCTLWVRSFAVCLFSCFLCCLIEERPRVRWTVRQIRAAHAFTDGRCYYCRVAFRTDLPPTHRKGVWEMDHFFAVSRRGLDAIENIVPSCVACNASKGAKSPFAFAAEQGRVLGCQHVDAASGRMCMRDSTFYVADTPPLCRSHGPMAGA